MNTYLPLAAAAASLVFMGLLHGCASLPKTGVPKCSSPQMVMLSGQVFEGYAQGENTRPNREKATVEALNRGTRNLRVDVAGSVSVSFDSARDPKERVRIDERIESATVTFRGTKTEHCYDEHEGMVLAKVMIPPKEWARQLRLLPKTALMVLDCQSTDPGYCDDVVKGAVRPLIEGVEGFSPTGLVRKPDSVSSDDPASVVNFGIQRNVSYLVWVTLRPAYGGQVPDMKPPLQIAHAWMNVQLLETGDGSVTWQSTVDPGGTGTGAKALLPLKAPGRRITPKEVVLKAIANAVGEKDGDLRWELRKHKPE